MRSVSRIVMMRPVDLFAEHGMIDQRHVQRAERAGKGMRMIGVAARAARAGRTVSKGNLILAWVDAGLAVLDAVASYATYRQAVEVTRQLEIEADALRARLAEMRRQCEALAGQSARERKQGRDHLVSLLAEQWEALRIDRDHYALCKADVSKIGLRLAVVRQQAPPSCPHLATLERLFHQLVAVQVAAAVVLIES